MNRSIGLKVVAVIAAVTLGVTGAWLLTQLGGSEGSHEAIRDQVSAPQAPLTATGQANLVTVQAPTVGWRVAYAASAVDVYDAPAGTVTETVSSTATYGSMRAMLVVPDGTHAPGWVRVMLPERWGTQFGWVREESVSVEPTTREIHIYVAERELELVEGDTVLLSTAVAVGTDKTPTPTGITYVTELLDLSASPSGPYGPFAIALARYSDSFEIFNGGKPQLAIHGTNAPSSIGQNASNGCVRVPNETITQLGVQLHLGTPVIIHASRDA